MLAGLFLLAGMLLSCTDDTAEPTPPDQNDPATMFTCEDNEEVCALASDQTEFGLNLFREIHKRDANNVFISPLSVSTALTMTLNGAKGQTFDDMQQTLELEDWQLQNVNEAYKAILEVLPALDPDIAMEMANSIWSKEGYPVHQEFLEVNQNYFSSEVKELDFSAPDAVDIINGWIEDNTNGLIQDALDMIPASTVMYIINTIYFKGTWRYEFDEEKTYQDQFFNLDGSSTMTDFMVHEAVAFPYFENDLLKAVDLPYGNGAYSMTCLLPKEGRTLDELINNLNIQNLNSWLEQFQKDTIAVFLPKFTLEYKLLLNDVLSAMGMEIAFGGGADLTGIADADLYINRVIHQTYVEVDEKGTEAAAVTIVEINETSAPAYPTIRMDQPFVFMIREKQTGSVLFIGKVVGL